MAKRRRRARRGTGSIIAVRQLSGTGLGKASNPSSALGSALPPIVGGGLTGASTMLLEHMAKPNDKGEVPNETIVKLAEHAPLVGLGVGLVGAGAMYALVGAPAGVSGAVSAVVVGGALYAVHRMKATTPTATTEPAPAPTSTSGVGRYRMRRLRGTGAIVPQVMPAGMGAITMEQVAGVRGLGYGSDPRGETVSLGNVNPGAFGTPGFHV